MTPPTLTLGATVVTLPAPSIDSPYVQGFDIRQVQRRTIGGKLRTTVLSYGYVYELDFRFALQSVYNSIRSLWLDATMTGTYPTFSYTDAFVEADEVPVAIALGAFTSAGIPEDFTRGHFTIQLSEANPR